MLLAFSRLLFFLRFSEVSECFPVISGFNIAINIQIYYYFSTLFWVLASGPPLAKFSFLNTDMCKFESIKESRTLSADS